MLTTTTCPSRQSDCARSARMAQLKLIQEARRPLVDADRLRQRLACGFLVHGWLMMRPEPVMAAITRMAAGPSLN